MQGGKIRSQRIYVTSNRRRPEFHVWTAWTLRGIIHCPTNNAEKLCVTSLVSSLHNYKQAMDGAQKRKQCFLTPCGEITSTRRHNHPHRTFVIKNSCCHTKPSARDLPLRRSFVRQPTQKLRVTSSLLYRTHKRLIKAESRVKHVSTVTKHGGSSGICLFGFWYVAIFQFCRSRALQSRLGVSVPTKGRLKNICVFQGPAHGRQKSSF